MKSKRMRWVGHEGYMGDVGNAYIISFGKSNHLGSTRIDERVVLRWMLRKYYVRV
jgi:hypothetical protein